MSGALGDRRLAGGAQLADPLVHRAAILRLHSYRATVAAIAAFSDSARDRDRRRRVARGDRPCRAAPRAPRRPRASRRRRPRRSGSPPWATSAILRPGSSLGSRTRTTGTANSAPIDARTALCPYGSAVPGPSATLAAPNASALRSAVPTLPGSLTPHSARHSGPVGAGAQRCAVDAERARARAELRDLGEQVRLDLVAVEPGALRRPAAPAAPSRRRRRRRAGPRPRPRTGAACPATCGPRACGSP